MKLQLIALVAVVGTAVTPMSVVAANQPASGDSHKVIQQLQAQIKQVQDSIAPAVQAQAKVTQKQIQQLQSQTQSQFKHVQTQMQQLQDNLIKQIQKLANSQSGGSAPKK